MSRHPPRRWIRGLVSLSRREGRVQQGAGPQVLRVSTRRLVGRDRPCPSHLGTACARPYPSPFGTACAPPQYCVRPTVPQPPRYRVCARPYPSPFGTACARPCPSHLGYRVRPTVPKPPRYRVCPTVSQPLGTVCTRPCPSPRYRVCPTVSQPLGTVYDRPCPPWPLGLGVFTAHPYLFREPSREGPRHPSLPVLSYRAGSRLSRRAPPPLVRLRSPRTRPTTL